jgi:hypothetical protein
MIKKKSFWAGLALVATGVVQIISKDVQGGIITISQGLAVIFVRSAISKLEK